MYQPLFKNYFERESKKEHGGRAERERERIPSRLCAVSVKLYMGLDFIN